MTPLPFITVLVDEHGAIPDGCCMRFKAVGSPARAVTRVRLDDGPGDDGAWLVEGCDEADAATVAQGIVVEDSSAGESVLVYGGRHGLRLRRAGGTEVVAEPYLLLAPEAVLE